MSLARCGDGDGCGKMRRWKCSNGAGNGIWEYRYSRYHLFLSLSLLAS